MFSDSQLLLMALLLPLAGAGLVCALARQGRAAVRQSALVTTLLTLAVVVLLVARFLAAGPEAGEEGQRFAASAFPWLGAGSGLDIELSVGLDGLSLWLFALSALLSVTAVLVSWRAIEDRAPAFYALLLLLEAGMLGVFAARDLILFYVFFEFTLIPLFFLIGIWGSEERRYAAIKFFLFTLAGSVLTFLGLLAIALLTASPEHAGQLTFSIPALTAALQARPLSDELQLWLFLALFAGFAIKVPLVPLHTWLPLAHVQAPTAGSVLLAGVLLKIGTYGFARLAMPLLPSATVTCMPYLLWLSVAGIVYGALVALAQSDIKRLIAYSSVSHLGYCMLGLFAFNRLGMQGGTLQMVNHGLSTGGLFACVGMLYERYHTRRMRDLGGLARDVPWLAFFMLLFALSSIGLPGLNGFAGELLVLLGMFQRAWVAPPAGMEWSYLAIALLALLGVVLGAWYMLRLVRLTFFGPPRDDAAHGAVRDLDFREICALAPLAALILWIGLVPGFFLRPMAPTLDRLADRLERQYHLQFDVADERRLAGSLDPTTGDALRRVAARDDDDGGDVAR